MMPKDFLGAPYKVGRNQQVWTRLQRFGHQGLQ